MSSQRNMHKLVISFIVFSMPLIAEAQSWNFDVSMDGKPIGTHQFILSETAMQDAFNKMYKVGEHFPINDKEVLCRNIQYYKDPANLKKQQWYNYQLAKELLNWEKESKKLLAII